MPDSAEFDDLIDWMHRWLRGSVRSPKQVLDLEDKLFVINREQSFEYLMRLAFPEEPAIRWLSRNYSKYDTAEVERLADLARTSQVAERVFQRVCAEVIKRGLPIPELARDLASELMMRDLRPTRRKGPSPLKNEGRDTLIRFFVQKLTEDFGVPATRSQSRTPSACSIVHEVLLSVGHSLTEDAVEKIASEK